ncbi:SusC/RagA family TonB-linked outer membrane protein [Psychroflexus aestuariivivens]|uniref:SusC/RagA family TonB-linked outer membrane protein n=1 Tax=Psychroflexus aestuariivivens TaxID=1795040 RepID=UPI000FD7ED6D|nr:SusC/RagA family TonB-linked outer membrane protein [Psychroflexus aestuariivivens]
MRTKFSGILTLLLAFVVQVTFAQTQTVTGSVTDGDGLPIPGVNIIVKGTSTGTQSDFDGNYSIEASSEQTLVFKYIGYKTKEVKVGNQSTINVSLKVDTEELEAVTVTAYRGILKDSDVSSAISTVKSKSIEQVPIASVDQVLQGNVAGANIRVTSGQPGAAAQTIIRGRTSLSGNTQPLYVIDGVPVSEDNFRSLNANDIADISVLKDGAGAAAYGSRGAAGVILITTKRGKRNSGLKIQYRSLLGSSENPSSNVEMMNSRQLLTFQKNLLPGAQFGDGLSDAEIDALSTQNNTNWADILFRKGRTESHELVLQQGGENLSSYTSLQYFEQEGTTLRSKLQRFSFRNNLEGGNDKFSYGTNINLNYSKSNFVVDATRGGNTGGDLDNPFITPFVSLPYLNPYNPDGSLNKFGTFRSGAYLDQAQTQINYDGVAGFQNTPFIALNTAEFNTDVENELRIVGGGNLNYKFNDNWSIGGTLGLDYIQFQNLAIDAPESIRGFSRFATQPEILDDFNGGTQFENFFRDFSFNTNARISYNNLFDEKHKVYADVLTEYYYSNIQNGGFQAFGLNPKLPGSGSGFTDGAAFFDPDPENPTIDDRTYPFIPNAFSSEIEEALLSYFTTFGYSYDNKYGVDFTVRRDGSSRFNEDYRWGTFFSASGRWNIDREAFMDDVDFVSSLKLRASYGEAGNRSIGAGFYAGFQTLSGTPGYRNDLQISAASLADEQVQWETTKQTNIGVDFGLFDNKLTGAVDVYQKDTEDLFFARALSAAATGFTSTSTNVGDMRNSGVELQVSYDLFRQSSTSDWGVNIFFNGAYNENEVLNIENEAGFVEGGSSARIQEGRRAFTYFMQRWAGVDPANGQPLYLDAEGNLTTEYDRAANGVYVDKQFDPVFQGGFGTSVSWKNFSLDALFSYQYDTWKVNSTYALTEDASLAGLLNVNTSMLDSWQEPGDVTSMPGLQYGGLRGQAGDRYLEDASFLRLRNLTIAYNVDSEILEKTKVFSGARVYVQGTNLLTWTEWRGFDPEIGELGEFFNYPTPRVYSVGLDLTF